MPPATLPGQRDWFDGPYDDDVNYAYKLYFGKTVAEALPHFRRNPIERAHELAWVPGAVFRYYVFAFVAYLGEIRLAAAGEEPEDDWAPSAASCFLGLIQSRLERDPESVLPVFDELRPVIEQVTAHQTGYGADVDIFGDFRERRDAIIDLHRRAAAELRFLPPRY